MRIRIFVAAIATIAAVLAVGTALAGGHGKPNGNGHGNGKGHGNGQGRLGPSLENRALFAVLTGRNEIGPDGRRGAGDPDGRGSFTATVDGNQICFGITVKNIDAPAAAHIHRGRRNENGPVVVPLTAPSAGDPGASSGCVTVDAALARAILRHPHKYYANVHTGAFQAGAVRGQLFRHSN